MHTERLDLMIDRELVHLAPSWSLRAAPRTMIGLLALRGVRNPATSDAVNAAATALETELRDRYAGQDRAAILATPPFPAYTDYFKRFGQRYHVALQLESIAFKGKALPRVAALVEAMFIAELRHGLLTAGHDLDQLTPPITVAIGDGSETFATPRGETATVKADDIYTASREGVLSAIITGPSALARITPETTNALFVVYAPPGVDEAAITAHFDEIARLAAAVAGNTDLDERRVIISGTTA